MLVLSRQRDEIIMIGDDIEVTVVDIRGDKVRIGINAPKSLSVHRKEVYDAIRKQHPTNGRVTLSDFEMKSLPEGSKICPTDIDPDQWRKDQDATWVSDGRPPLLIPVARQCKYVGVLDVAYGDDYLFDGNKWHKAQKGVFLPEACFMSDYYGYLGGQLFVKH